MSLVPHLHTLFSAYWLVHPLKKSLSFLHKCLIYLWSTLKGYWKTKLNFHCSPLENSMVLLNRAQISPIHFCWNTWKAFSLCSSWTITNVYIHLPKKSFSFDLGRNGYQMNISLTCSLLKGRKRFLLSDLILIFLSFSYLVTHSTCLQSWVEKWEFITLFFFSCYHWFVCQESLSGILRWPGNAPSSFLLSPFSFCSKFFTRILGTPDSTEFAMTSRMEW